MRIVALRVCAGKAKECVEATGEHTHIAYLVVAVLAESNIALRVSSGGLLVCCIASRVLKAKEAH